MNVSIEKNHMERTPSYWDMPEFKKYIDGGYHEEGMMGNNLVILKKEGEIVQLFNIETRTLEPKVESEDINQKQKSA